MPSKIYVKYHSYDKKTDSLIVSFASNETESQNPADYNPVVIQPSLQFPNITNQTDLEKEIASMGKNITEQQKIIELCNKNKASVMLCESLVKKGTDNYNLDS
jgi:hypothetical protein